MSKRQCLGQWYFKRGRAENEDAKSGDECKYEIEEDEFAHKEVRKSPFIF